MAVEKFINNVTDTLNGGINNSTTSVVVTTGSLFPTAGNYRVIIDNEIMIVTSRSSNTLTVTRGAESTSGASHSSGASISIILTGGGLENLIHDNNLIGAAASRPAAGFAGRKYYCTDEPFILLDDGTKWISFHGGFLCHNPNDVTWTVGRDHEGDLSSFSIKEFYRTIKEASVGSSGIGYNSYKRAAPSAPYKMTALLSHVASQASYQMPAIGFHNSGDNKVQIIRYWANANGQNTIIYSTGTGWVESSVTDVTTFNVIPTSYIWLQIEDNNTNLIFRFSYDGINFIQLASVSRTGFMSAPNYVWWGTQLFGSGEIVGTNLLSWLEE